jgi:alcohol dehydrogenase (NADP+)
MAVEQFEGWCGLAPDAAQGKMVWQGYQPKEWEESDVDIEVSTSAEQSNIPRKLTLFRSTAVASVEATFMFYVTDGA